MTLLLDALACFRLTRLVTQDVILDRPRDAVIDWATAGPCDATLEGAGGIHLWDGVKVCNRPAGHGEIHHAARGTDQIAWTDDEDGATSASVPARHHPKVAEFAQCPWCVGMWIAFGVVAARRFAPKAWEPLARVLAFSAVAGMIASRD